MTTEADPVVPPKVTEAHIEALDRGIRWESSYAVVKSYAPLIREIESLIAGIHSGTYSVVKTEEIEAVPRGHLETLHAVIDQLESDRLTPGEARFCLAQGFDFESEFAQRFGEKCRRISAQDPTVPITVNGESVTVDSGPLYYEDVLGIVGVAPERLLSVTYSTRGGNSGGILTRGQWVMPKAGMIFDAVDTSRA